MTSLVMGQIGRSGRYYTASGRRSNDNDVFDPRPEFQAVVEQEAPSIW
jgi:hypothetical protein